ncbi:16S rRNA methyltransferase [Pseudoalteromonas luteoviolacea]|uniref:Ribosomal RNA small subunit methyltransferase C n=1 Tax=Pseudoalteromonas luteoviolacea TaxID=43657 RepID=A0A1C0TPZ4_9GAMM|nr:methyltransferase [Pseudoalteromonas luteoviolacea]MBQ4811901.1 methyltransferase [Pseudoalteromonas luteoviolacea]OCQ20935.1 16S rRNA methyltransferase [Pseudoalteromonas luteoviolacea]
MQKLSNPSLLLLRNEEELTGKNILVINHSDDGFLSQLATLNPNANINAFSYNFAVHQAAQKLNSVSSFVGHSLPELAQLDLVIYYYPKSKPEAQMMLSNIRAISSSDTRLLVVGENKGGVKSVEKQLKSYAEASFKLDSAKHCILYEFNNLSPEHQFDITHYHQQFRVKAADQEFDAVSVPGVFNHGKLDVGTELLLNNITLPERGQALDFGCGAGIIATFILNKRPNLSMHCLDVSALALYASEQTLKLNGHKGTYILSNGLSEVTEKYDAIISNPPFHTGLSTDYSISEAFIKNAKHIMHKRASLQIVANSFLKYPPIIEQYFGTYSTTIKNTKFAVYHADKT